MGSHVWLVENSDREGAGFKLEKSGWAELTPEEHDLFGSRPVPLLAETAGLGQQEDDSTDRLHEFSGETGRSPGTCHGACDF